MDKERIVGASSNWDRLKDIFYSLGLNISHRADTMEYVSHGVMVIVDGKGLFLQMTHTYEYMCILHGFYTGVKLYHYLSLISPDERALLMEHPFVQWRYAYPYTNMPGDMYRKLSSLQKHLSVLYELIPIVGGTSITIPKGRTDGDEDSASTALRELYEETGIVIHKNDLCGPILETFIGTDGNMYTTYIYAAYLNEYPTVTLGHEFNRHLWLHPFSNLLMKRQVRILDTFVSNVNVRGDNCRWIRQKGTARHCSTTEDSKEQTIECEKREEQQIIHPEGDIQLSNSPGNDCTTVQSKSVERQSTTCN